MFYKRFQRFNQFKARLTYNDGSVKTVIGEQSEVDQFERDVAPQCHEVLAANYRGGETPLPLPNSFMTDEDRQALGVEREVGQLSAGRVEHVALNGETPLEIPDWYVPPVARPAANANQRPQRAAQPQTGETPLPTPAAAWRQAFNE